MSILMMMETTIVNLIKEVEKSLQKQFERVLKIHLKEKIREEVCE